jgi:hypothetical protein
VTVKFLDLISEQKDPFTPKGTPPVSPSKVVGGKTVKRDPKTVTGITLHQTACVFGPSADREKAYRRALGIPAHAVAFRDGVVAIPAPLSWYLYTSNGLNAATLGLEIEGIYPGYPGAKVWGSNPATPFTELARDTARAALKYLLEKGREAGMPIEYLYAHRQSNGQKPSDPGFEIWQQVALEYGVNTLGLKTRNDYVVGDGKQLPSAWDPTSKVKY